jgi:hypothetical protein
MMRKRRCPTPPTPHPPPYPPGPRLLPAAGQAEAAACWPTVASPSAAWPQHGGVVSAPQPHRTLPGSGPGGAPHGARGLHGAAASAAATGAQQLPPQALALAMDACSSLEPLALLFGPSQLGAQLLEATHAATGLPWCGRSRGGNGGVGGF